MQLTTKSIFSLQSVAKQKPVIKNLNSQKLPIDLINNNQNKTAKIKLINQSSKKEIIKLKELTSFLMENINESKKGNLMNGREIGEIGFGVWRTPTSLSLCVVFLFYQGDPTRRNQSFQ